VLESQSLLRDVGGGWYGEWLGHCGGYWCELNLILDTVLTLKEGG